MDMPKVRTNDIQGTRPSSGRPYLSRKTRKTAFQGNKFRQISSSKPCWMQIKGQTYPTSRQNRFPTFPGPVRPQAQNLLATIPKAFPKRAGSPVRPIRDTARIPARTSFVFECKIAIFAPSPAGGFHWRTGSFPPGSGQERKGKGTTANKTTKNVRTAALTREDSARNPGKKSECGPGVVFFRPCFFQVHRSVRSGSISGQGRHPGSEQNKKKHTNLKKRFAP